VAQTADAGDRHPLSGPGVGHLEALVDSDAGAQDGSYFQFAPAARRPQPRVADLVTDLEVVHTLTECDDGAVALVAGDERRLRLDRPIAVRRMQIGVAHPGGLHFHQGFTVAGGGQFEIGNLQRGAEFGDHRGTHGVGRGVPCGGRINGVCVMASFQS
jgi:hypothetical protein